MSRVLALVEGHTEQAFIREVLAPELGLKGVYATARLVGKPGHKGGVRRWAIVRRDIVAALKQDRSCCCTTMFDYYALPADWPGASTARHKHFRTAVSEIERAVRADITREFGEGFDAARLVPYIQLHEFEALLFSNTEVLAETVQHPNLRECFDEALTQCKEPEGIDDTPAGAPSKRIGSVAPEYDKVLHGTIAAKRIGLAAMRRVCPHFDEWVTRLEGLGVRDAA